MPIYFRFLLSVTAVCLVGCPENITSSGSCVSDSQCEFPKICRDGKCLVQCFLDSECAETAACVYNRCVESASSSDGGADARPVTDSSMTDASQPITDAGQAIDGSFVDSGVVTSDMAVSSDANASADAQTSSDFGATDSAAQDAQVSDNGVAVDAIAVDSAVQSDAFAFDAAPQSDALIDDAAIAQPVDDGVSDDGGAGQANGDAGL